MFEQYKYTINCLCNYVYLIIYNVFFRNIISVFCNCLKFFKIQRLTISQVCEFFFCEQ